MKHFLTLSSFLISVAVLAQTTYTVDNNTNSGAQFQSAQAAINAAAIGDTIYIHPSQESYGNVDVTKTLHLRGMAHHPEYNDGLHTEFGTIDLDATIGAAGTTVSGLKFNTLKATGNQDYSNVVITNNRCEKIQGTTTQCDNWVIRGNVIDANTFGIINNNTSDGWIVVNNYIRQNATNVSWYIFEDLNQTDLVRNNIITTRASGDATSLFHECLNLTIENSLILFTESSPGINFSGSSVTFNNCLSYHYPGLTMDDLNGDNNLNNTDPMFVNGGSIPSFSYSKDFNIQPGSPASGAGTDGQDLGIYGNSYPFNMRGYPEDLPYPTNMQIQNSVIEPGGTLNVIFEAEGN